VLAGAPGALAVKIGSLGGRADLREFGERGVLPEGRDQVSGLGTGVQIIGEPFLSRDA